MEQADISGYRWSTAELNESHGYLLPAVEAALSRLAKRRLFDLGCGNGSVCAHFARLGWDVTGVDPSTEGIGQARRQYPELKIHVGSAYDPLAERYGTFPCVISLEVIEHLYDPRRYAKTLFSLLEPGGIALVSTPYHGYWKNLAMAVTGKLDGHFTVLWDHGHIKFWSIRTLTRLLTEAGFELPIEFSRVGRIPAFAKSMVALARRR
jgi:2-polyprenyl-3-methyl-5-hydroxy-6-metoxy-1,4-benzoquinol methylase